MSKFWVVAASIYIVGLEDNPLRIDKWKDHHDIDDKRWMLPEVYLFPIHLSAHE